MRLLGPTVGAGVPARGIPSALRLLAFRVFVRAVLADVAHGCLRALDVIGSVWPFVGSEHDAEASAVWMLPAEDWTLEHAASVARDFPLMDDAGGVLLPPLSARLPALRDAKEFVRLVAAEVPETSLRLPEAPVRPEPKLVADEVAVAACLKVAECRALDVDGVAVRELDLRRSVLVPVVWEQRPDGLARVQDRHQARLAMKAGEIIHREHPEQRAGVLRDCPGREHVRDEGLSSPWRCDHVYLSHAVGFQALQRGKEMAADGRVERARERQRRRQDHVVTRPLRDRSAVRDPRDARPLCCEVDHATFIASSAAASSFSARCRSISSRSSRKARVAAVV